MTTLLIIVAIDSRLQFFDLPARHSVSVSVGKRQRKQLKERHYGDDCSNNNKRPAKKPKESFVGF